VREANIWRIDLEVGCRTGGVAGCRGASSPGAPLRDGGRRTWSDGRRSARGLSTHDGSGIGRMT